MTELSANPFSASCEIGSRFLRWIFSLEPIEVRLTSEADVLARSFHITAKCRYNAAIRLKRLGTFSFLTATFLSLGLILIPLLQLSGLSLAYPPRVLNGLQIFLAVAVLVYSVINATAHYEARAQSLNDCGDRIKELGRELRSQIASGAPPDLKAFNQRYTEISADSENHARPDYGLAMLQSRALFRITGAPRIWLRFKVLISEGGPYIMPLALWIAGIILILDILAITSILTPRLNRLSIDSNNTAQPPAAVGRDRVSQ